MNERAGGRGRALPSCFHFCPSNEQTVFGKNVQRHLTTSFQLPGQTGATSHSTGTRDDVIAIDSWPAARVHSALQSWVFHSTPLATKNQAKKKYMLTDPAPLALEWTKTGELIVNSNKSTIRTWPRDGSGLFSFSLHRENQWIGLVNWWRKPAQPFRVGEGDGFVDECLGWIRFFVVVCYFLPRASTLNVGNFTFILLRDEGKGIKMWIHWVSSIFTLPNSCFIFFSYFVVQSLRGEFDEWKLQMNEKHSWPRIGVVVAAERADDTRRLNGIRTEQFNEKWSKKNMCMGSVPWFVTVRSDHSDASTSIYNTNKCEYVFIKCSSCLCCIFHGTFSTQS